MHATGGSRPYCFWHELPLFFITIGSILYVSIKDEKGCILAQLKKSFRTQIMENRILPLYVSQGIQPDNRSSIYELKKSI